MDQRSVLHPGHLDTKDQRDTDPGGIRAYMHHV